MVQLTINEKQIEVPEGTTVLRAAEIAGIHIPKLCDHKELTPYGGCRLCLVEVEGARVPLASCTLPVNQGMVVRTETDALKESRQFILSMLFSERNHFCPFCQVSGGDCELQNAAYEEKMTHWPIQPGWNNFAVDTSHPYFILDNNRCILCRRCVRACSEMAGNFTLSVAERGAKSLIVADTDILLGESSCIKCGSCVQVCPTGALIDRVSAYQGHAQQLDEIKSVCVGCSVGCAIKIMVRDNRIVRIEGDWNGPVNRGVLCEHGRYDPVTESRKRITSPRIKKNGKFEVVSWEEALQTVAKKLQANVGNNIAAIASTRLSVETLSTFKTLFAEKLQSSFVTSTEEGFPTAVISRFAEKQGAFEGKLSMLRNADTVLCIGTNVNRSHMVAGFLFKRNTPKGTQIINIDSRDSEMDEIANISLKPKADSDLALVKGLQAIIVKEKLGRTPLSLSEPDTLIQQAVTHTGISLEELQSTAETLAKSISPVILFGKGITAQKDESLIEELYRLAVLVGAIDSERNGLLSLKGEANSLAASLLSLDTEFKLKDSKVVYVALGDGYMSKSQMKRISNSSYLILQASYESEITERADVILPVTIWAEEEGHYISLDGRIQTSHKALNAPENIYDNLSLLNKLATQTNFVVDEDWQKAIAMRTSSVSFSYTEKESVL